MAAVPTQKALQGSDTDRKEILGGTERRSFPDKGSLICKHRWTLCKAGKTSLQLNGHHKSKQKRDLLCSGCSALHATEKFHLH